MSDTIGYFDRMGVISVKALTVGGEELLDRATTAMAVATRHLHRVEVGQMPLTPAVAREIEASLDRADALIHEAEKLPAPRGLASWIQS